ncbi:PilZ domain-containing protein [Paenibacillus alvei]|uniref:PilZ domain-containing protein n=1 Tax=Paenibacillus TaxID=44249 RepID=UPI0022810498|nr:PilZ domain-containing protein [Paenibacillus alvei]
MTGAYVTDAPEHLLMSLLHSRTVLEGDNCIATGVLSYLEGDVMEVELPEFERFELGEALKVTIYSPVGIFNFHTQAVARHEGSLMLIHPPHQQRKFTDQRLFPRIEVRKHGYVLPSRPAEGMAITPTPIPIHIEDISLNGIGFNIKGNSSFVEGSELEAELQLGFAVPCRLTIVRMASREDDIFYGAKLQVTSDPAQRSLRAFIMREQIKSHIDRKSKNSITARP